MGSSPADYLCLQPMSTDIIQKPQSDLGLSKPGAGAPLKQRVPKLRKYVLTMLKEKHNFDEESLDSILEQPDKDKSAPLQSFSDLLYQCLQAYKEEFPAPFEQHYSYTKLTELSASKMVHDDFRCLNKDL